MSIQLARRAAAGDMSAEVLTWLSAGLARHLSGDSLENALGLDRASRLKARNQALLSAASLIDNGGGPWETAGRLTEAIRRCETRVLPLLRRDQTYALAPLDRLLADAFATGQRIPRTQRKLYELLR